MAFCLFSPFDVLLPITFSLLTAPAAMTAQQVAEGCYGCSLFVLWFFWDFGSLGHKNIGCCTVFRSKHMLIVFQLLFFFRSSLFNSSVFLLHFGIVFIVFQMLRCGFIFLGTRRPPKQYFHRVGWWWWRWWRQGNRWQTEFNDMSYWGSKHEPHYFATRVIAALMNGNMI